MHTKKTEPARRDRGTAAMPPPPGPRGIAADEPLRLDTQVAPDTHVTQADLVAANDTSAASPLMTYEQASELLAVKKSTLFGWVAESHVPHLRFGPRTVRFCREDLEHWMLRCRRGSHLGEAL